jgi:hypothetical protein
LLTQSGIFTLLVGDKELLLRGVQNSGKKLGVLAFALCKFSKRGPSYLPAFRP